MSKPPGSPIKAPLGVAASLAVIVVAAAVAAESEPAQRAARPKFAPDVVDLFFDDARQQLAGERPDPQAGQVAAAGGATKDAASSFGWSQWISGEALADEVKRIANALRAPLANPGKFRSGGYQQCRLHFSVAAIAFGVIECYDGDVRFKADAASMRAALAAAAAACESGSPEAYEQSQAAFEDLQVVLRGGTVDGPPGDDQAWSELAERPLLMQRMETALNEAIQPALANERTFRRADLDVAREAQLLAMLAEVIVLEDYDYRDDDDYAASARELRDAAADMARAAEDGNYESARAAAGRASQSCTVCHEGFRG